MKETLYQQIAEEIDRELKDQRLTLKWLMFNMDMNRTTYQKRRTGMLKWKQKEVEGIGHLLQSEEILHLAKKIES